jgi:hypothetical protein
MKEQGKEFFFYCNAGTYIFFMCIAYYLSNDIITGCCRTDSLAFHADLNFDPTQGNYIH